MTHFNIDQSTDQPDRIFVEVDRRFNVAIIRAGAGLELRIYPRTDGELWDAPFATFEVDEAEIVSLEAEAREGSRHLDRVAVPLEPSTPWTLHFDRDGTEDVAVICDADGDDLVRSRHFWLPEGDDPIPPTLAALRLMVAAPKLLAACRQVLAGMEDDALDGADDPQGCTQTERDIDTIISLREVIAEATGGGG